MPEHWDLYDQNRKPLGRRIVRGDKIAPGEYHIVVEVWTLNSRGEILITRRDPRKKLFPGKWECSTGAVLAGETSRQGAVRELREETGIIAMEDELLLVGTCSQGYWGAFLDTYLLRKDVPLEDLVMQEGETTAAQWITLDRFYEMIKSEDLVFPLGIRYGYLEPAFHSALGL